VDRHFEIARVVEYEMGVVNSLGMSLGCCQHCIVHSKRKEEPNNDQVKRKGRDEIGTSGGDQ
jgi:hypothetical protein